MVVVCLPRENGPKLPQKSFDLHKCWKTDQKKKNHQIAMRLLTLRDWVVVDLDGYA